MIPTPARILACVVVPVCAALLAACSSAHTVDVPFTDGWGPAGGTNGGSSSGSAQGATSSSSSGGAATGGSSSGAGGSSGSSSGGTSSGAGSSGGTSSGGTSSGGTSSGGPTFDAGGGGGGKDASPPPAAPLGSCANPNCGTDTTECGCQATDSAGDTVQMGCQAGGECVCVINNQTQDNPFPEDNACADQASTRTQFLTNCACQ
jgi:hypothetical protein